MYLFSEVVACECAYFPKWFRALCRFCEWLRASVHIFPGSGVFACSCAYLPKWLRASVPLFPGGIR